MEDKKVLTLLLGSPRIGGNTEKLADALAEGAAEKGYEVKKVHLATLTLKGCLDCRKCWSTGKPCIQNDDMDQVYPEIEDASVIAFVSPLYFYSWSSQIKPVWDRLLPYYMPGALRTTPSKRRYCLQQQEIRKMKPLKACGHPSGLQQISWAGKLQERYVHLISTQGEKWKRKA